MAHLLVLFCALTRVAIPAEDGTLGGSEENMTSDELITSTRSLLDVERVVSNCQTSADCIVKNSICVRSQCKCAHGYYPHFHATHQNWSCLLNPVNSTCCGQELTLPSQPTKGTAKPTGHDEETTSKMTDVNQYQVFCYGGDKVCRSRLGELARCDSSQTKYGSCQCVSPATKADGYYDSYENVCTPCHYGTLLNGNCTSLLEEYCTDMTDRCRSQIGFSCRYNHKCSCSNGYYYNCETKRCVKDILEPDEIVNCPHIIRNHVFGTLPCDKKSGCWRVLVSKGVTAGCVDMLVSLLPARCGIVCKLEYQGYGECEESPNGVVCFSCTPNSSTSIAHLHLTVCIAVVNILLVPFSLQ